MRALGDVLFRQPRNGHRRFALSVDLGKPRTEAIERLQDILDIHRRAAPDQCADILDAGVGGACDHAFDHGWRREHR